MTVATLILALVIGIFEIIDKIKWTPKLFIIFTLVVFMLFHLGAQRILDYQLTLANNQIRLENANPDIWSYENTNRTPLFSLFFHRHENEYWFKNPVSVFAFYCLTFMIYMYFLKSSGYTGKSIHQILERFKASIKKNYTEEEYLDCER